MKCDKSYEGLSKPAADVRVKRHVFFFEAVGHSGRSRRCGGGGFVGVDGGGESMGKKSEKKKKVGRYFFPSFPPSDSFQGSRRHPCLPKLLTVRGLVGNNAIFNL